MMFKRGQGAPAAVLLAIIAALIVIFIMLIPPADRAELLGEDSDDGTTVSSAEKLLLDESPGRLSYLKDKTIEKIIPSFHIFTKTEPEVLAEKEFLTVKNAVFSSQPKNLYFGIDDLDKVDNILLSVNIDSYQGRLIILLNDEEIFDKETYKLRPLKLPSNLLAKDNVLTFKVSSPGIAFWRTNFYELKDILVVADVTDVSNQKSDNLVTIPKDEFDNLEEASLKFYLSCLSTEKGNLEIRLNDKLVFGGTPETCEDFYRYQLPIEELKSGSNWVDFWIEEGNYQFDQAAVRIDLAEPTYPTYNFEIDQKYFVNDTEELKEDYDIVLTVEFVDDSNKEAEIYVNGHKLGFDTYKVEFSYKLNNYVEPWLNSIKIIPENSFEIKSLKVELKD